MKLSKETNIFSAAQDTPDWADQMTLDYNFEANYWAAATSNRAELMEPYFATVNSLMKIGEQRASLPDWSEGGYPDCERAKRASLEEDEHASHN